MSTYLTLLTPFSISLTFFKMFLLILLRSLYSCFLLLPVRLSYSFLCLLFDFFLVIPFHLQSLVLHFLLSYIK